MTSGPERGSGGLRARLHASRTGRASQVRMRSGRAELSLALVLGAVGAGVVFLASRQGWAQVRTIPPRPLPPSTVTVTGAALVPYADALVVAGLATLAAVLASRGFARRLTGILLALLGASLAASAFTVSSAAAITAANSNVGPATASAGSVTDGSTATSPVPNIAGAIPHVTFSAVWWQVLVVLGAIVMIGAGVLVSWRADRMAVMSSRYDSPASRSYGPGSDRRARSAGGRTTSPRPDPSPRAASAALPTDSASMWEALSRGDDPTAGRTPITRTGSAT
jgi:uncharacterized membrane protein (TIGR02234 family)